MITALAAAKAYASQGAMSVGSIGGGASAAKGMDFGDLLKNAMNDVTQSSKAAEMKVAEQVAGKAELIDVVTAISSAEASLETVMAVRDQVISAYQEIMRMPI
ncbi:MAG: flagellar hook-basal body complex protein FliE [Caulobacter sp. 12-67-6]|nr:MAG: flagellar hook-basal body complex protein FliE [Caulobacter sp. 12-67-6]OYX73439.1 MAG: flagellar hook-basal body complex protein FliE [Caulobacter sp. 32-67-35]OYX92890.1 MAG: flagellar hook-basal body complex protein FliE [Caulobacter sp. 35-67-4]OZA73221.1 MAG: flagellar hook-basal body complex protein FliE [Caulobacter sp. 39-67-4]HQR90958.1 flagellar hook-basal body complex protein FliE [Caulobacter sp.]